MARFLTETGPRPSSLLISCGSTLLPSLSIHVDIRSLSSELDQFGSSSSSRIGSVDDKFSLIARARIVFDPQSSPRPDEEQQKAMTLLSEFDDALGSGIPASPASELGLSPSNLPSFEEHVLLKTLDDHHPSKSSSSSSITFDSLSMPSSLTLSQPHPFHVEYQLLLRSFGASPNNEILLDTLSSQHRFLAIPSSIQVLPTRPRITKVTLQAESRLLEVTLDNTQCLQSIDPLSFSQDQDQAVELLWSLSRPLRIEKISPSENTIYASFPLDLSIPPSSLSDAEHLLSSNPSITEAATKHLVSLRVSVMGSGQYDYQGYLLLSSSKSTQIDSKNTNNLFGFGIGHKIATSLSTCTTTSSAQNSLLFSSLPVNEIVQEDIFGRTPVWWALWFGHAPTSMSILHAMAAAKDLQGVSIDHALQAAVKMGHKSLLEQLSISVHIPSEWKQSIYAALLRIPSSAAAASPSSASGSSFWTPSWIPLLTTESEDQQPQGEDSKKEVSLSLSETALETLAAFPAPLRIVLVGGDADNESTSSQAVAHLLTCLLPSVVVASSSSSISSSEQADPEPSADEASGVGLSSSPSKVKPSASKQAQPLSADGLYLWATPLSLSDSQTSTGSIVLMQIVSLSSSSSASVLYAFSRCISSIVISVIPSYSSPSEPSALNEKFSSSLSNWTNHSDTHLVVRSPSSSASSSSSSLSLLPTFIGLLPSSISSSESSILWDILSKQNNSNEQTLSSLCRSFSSCHLSALSSSSSPSFSFSPKMLSHLHARDVPLGAALAQFLSSAPTSNVLSSNDSIRRVGNVPIDGLSFCSFLRELLSDFIKNGKLDAEYAAFQCQRIMSQRIAHRQLQLYKAGVSSFVQTSLSEFEQVSSSPSALPSFSSASALVAPSSPSSPSASAPHLPLPPPSPSSLVRKLQEVQNSIEAHHFFEKECILVRFQHFTRYLVPEATSEAKDKLLFESQSYFSRILPEVEAFVEAMTVDLRKRSSSISSNSNSNSRNGSRPSSPASPLDSRLSAAESVSSDSSAPEVVISPEKKRFMHELQVFTADISSLFAIHQDAEESYQLLTSSYKWNPTMLLQEIHVLDSAAPAPEAFNAVIEPIRVRLCQSLKSVGFDEAEAMKVFAGLNLAGSAIPKKIRLSGIKGNLRSVFIYVLQATVAERRVLGVYASDAEVKLGATWSMFTSKATRQDLLFKQDMALESYTLALLGTHLSESMVNYHSEF